MSNIIVIAEVRGGSLKRPSLEAITAGQKLASANGGQVIALACGNGLDAAAAELGAAAKVITIDGPGVSYKNDGSDADVSVRGSVALNMDSSQGHA